MVAALAHLVEAHRPTPVGREATWRTGKIGRLLAWDDAGDDAQVAPVVHLGLALVDEPLENACCSVTVGLLLLELPQSVRELLDLLGLLLDLLLLVPLQKSRLLQLGLGAAPLGAGLEEIGPDALALYAMKDMISRKRKDDLRETFVEALKTAST